MPMKSDAMKTAPALRKRRGEYKTCPHCSKEFYLVPTRAARGEVYCSPACRLAATPTSEKVCAECGKTFVVHTSIADRYNVCSRECRLKKTKYTSCERCGKIFVAETRLNRHYCSEECRRPPVYLVCRTCGKEIRILPSDTDRQFCSFSCYRRFRGENLLEQKARSVLDGLGIAYTQEAAIGRYSVDFLLVAPRIALEIDGTYWHSNSDRDRRKSAYLTKHGWRVIRITESEIEHSDDLPHLFTTRLDIDHGNCPTPTSRV